MASLSLKTWVGACGFAAIGLDADRFVPNREVATSSTAAWIAQQTLTLFGSTLV